MRTLLDVLGAVYAAELLLCAVAGLGFWLRLRHEARLVRQASREAALRSMEAQERSYQELLGNILQDATAEGYELLGWSMK